MCGKPLGLILAASALAAAPAPAGAMQPCPSPADLIVLYPVHGATIAPDAVLYLRLRREGGGLGSPTSSLSLIALADKKTVELAIDPPTSSGLVRLRPLQRLRAGAYELRWAKPTSQGATSFMGYLEAPGWRFDAERRAVLAFKVGAGSAGRGRPELAAGNVELTQFIAAEPHTGGMVEVRGAGREGTLQLKAKPRRPPPVVVEVKLSYAGPEPWRGALPLGYEKAIQLVARGMRCGHPLSLPGAPRSGSYAIEATPWSANGESGPPLRLQGTLKP